MRVVNFSMVGLASRLDALLSGWVHARIVDDTDRARHVADFRIMLGVAALSFFGLPILLVCAFAPLTALACGAAVSALPLIVASVLCGTGSRAVAGAVALGLAGVAVAALSAGSGGFLSPFVVWAAGLPFCAAVAGRNWRWFAAGLSTMIACGSVAALFTVSPSNAGSAGLAAAFVPVAAIFACAVAQLSIAIERGRWRRMAPNDGNDGHRSCDLDLLPGLVTLHDLGGNVVSVHGADKLRFGEWLRQPSGQGFFQHVHVADRLGFMQAIDRLRHGQESASMDLRMQTFAGGHRADQFVHLRVDLRRMPEESGLILAQSRDVTAEVLAMREMEGTVEAAERANAAKTRFLSAVSHELRTPLNAILGFSDVLAGEYFGSFQDARQREYVDLIRQSGGHLLSVVNSMLDMSKIEAGRFQLALETFPVADAVRRCESMLALQARSKGVLLTSRIARSCGKVTADPRAVDQILINLVANAIKFTEKGGVVTIDADRDGDRLVLSVSDTGIGISAEHLDTIGQPFVQLENGSAYGSEGTGLGLSLVKGLVALHDGAFTISSRLGEGTVIKVALRRDGPRDAVAGADDGEGRPASAIEFPPRLSATVTDTRRGTQGIDDEDAQARTA